MYLAQKTKNSWIKAHRVISLNFLYWMDSICLFLVNTFHIFRLNDVVLSHRPRLENMFS